MRLLPSTIAAALLLAAGQARGQTDTFYRPVHTAWVLAYEMGQPLGGLADFVDSTSWVGFRLEGRWRVAEKISAGFVTNYSRYEQTYSLLTVQQPNGAFSGAVYRYVDTFSARGTAHYYLGSGAFTPYLGATLGGVWTYSYQQTADLAASDTSFEVVLGPDAGLLVTLRPGLALDLGISYSWTSADVGATQDAQYLNWRFGVAWFY